MEEKKVKELKWAAPEFKYYPKGFSWYFFNIVIAFSALLFCIWQRNFLFGFFVVAAELSFIYWANHQPRQINFELAEKGINIDKKFYPFEKLNGFAVKEDEIILRHKARLSTYSKILAKPDELEKIKNFLSCFLPSFEYEESIFDYLAKILKF